jgi:hypothetical protein
MRPKNLAAGNYRGAFCPIPGPVARFFYPALPYPLPDFFRAPCGPLAQPEGVFAPPLPVKPVFAPRVGGLGGSWGPALPRLRGLLNDGWWSA